MPGNPDPDNQTLPLSSTNKHSLPGSDKRNFCKLLKNREEQSEEGNNHTGEDGTIKNKYRVEGKIKTTPTRKCLITGIHGTSTAGVIYSTGCRAGWITNRVGPGVGYRTD